MKIIKLVLCLVGLAVLFMPKADTYEPRPAKEPQSRVSAESNQGVAYEFAKGFVEDRLASPSTAEFPSIWQLKYEQVDASTWKLWFYVDSQNAFGATVRTQCYTKVMYLGPSSWKLLDIKLK